ncbi:MAG: MoaD/ThiS family protein [Arenimonas sp.]
MTITVLYFASFQEAAGIDSETIEKPVSLTALFESLKLKYQFKFQAANIRVAVDGVFVGWQYEIRDGSEIAFIPPVSGG